MGRKLTAVVALTTTACTTWKVQPGPTPQAVQSAAHADEPIRLDMKRGPSLYVYDAAIVGDSVVGMSGPSSQARRMRLAVAMTDVAGVAVNKVSVGKTVLAVTAITLAALIIIGASSQPTQSTSSNSSCASAQWSHERGNVLV
jgi:hypothetical protein